MDIELQTKSSTDNLPLSTGYNSEGVNVSLERNKKMSGFAFAGKEKIDWPDSWMQEQRENI